MEKESLKKCLIVAKKMFFDHDILKLDIKSAFCCVAFEAIAQALRRTDCPCNIAQYIMNTL